MKSGYSNPQTVLGRFTKIKVILYFASKHLYVVMDLWNFLIRYRHTYQYADMFHLKVN